MTRMIFFTKRSVIFVLVVSNAFNPLFANEPLTHVIVKNQQQISTIEVDIKGTLIDKGLDEDAAKIKVAKLFKNSQLSNDVLYRLNNTPELLLSKEMLSDTLAKYALYEKSLDLSSYSSLIGFVQSASSKALNAKQLNAIKQISLLKS